MSTLSGRTALVTGGSRGIGRAIAERLGRDGARVAVHYGENEAAAKEVVAAVEAAGGSAFAIQATLGVPGDAEALWAAFDEQAEGLDVLVNNAGIASQLGTEGTTPEEFDRLMAVNAKAPFFITQLGLSRLRDGGRIINVSTVATGRASLIPSLNAYTMTKSALNAFTTVLAKELAPRGITVNAIAPGVVDTDMNAGWLHTGEEAWQQAEQVAALGRVGRPDDISDVVGFLASDGGRWITGQWLDVSGGSLL